MMGTVKKLLMIVAAFTVILVRSVSLLVLHGDAGKSDLPLYRPAVQRELRLSPERDMRINLRQTSGVLRLFRDKTEDYEKPVQELVEAFGKKLKMVSLLAPKELLISGLKEFYSPFVTPELLEKWVADPQSAPGRMVSSPWPDRIEIAKMEKNGLTVTVTGEIIEITSEELVHGGAAAKRPITLVVQKIKDNWLISGVTLGEYSACGPISYMNTQYGFEFCLPETWKGYSIVEKTWQGTSGGTVLASGPELLIRHPQWTETNPRQDIPIMVFTLEQWNDVQNEKFSVSAAPIGPTELGRNSRYVFALPPRYNYAFPTGYEEVEKILQGNPLRTTDQSWYWQSLRAVCRVGTGPDTIIIS